jgi:hypothetical protein
MSDSEDRILIPIEWNWCNIEFDIGPIEYCDTEKKNITDIK